MAEKGDVFSDALQQEDAKASTLNQMRGLSLSDTDLSNAKDDLDQQLAYNYMVLQMTSTPERTDELLYHYVNNFTRFSGVQLPPYLVKALHEVETIAKDTESQTFSSFMDLSNKEMADKEVRQDPIRFYKSLGRNFCHIGTMLQTMSIMMDEHGQTESDSGHGCPVSLGEDKKEQSKD